MPNENKIDSKKLIKWIYFIPVISIILTIILIATIFINKGKAIYSRDVIRYKKSLIRQKRVESEDRINRVIQQIQINRKIIEDESKKNIKNLVDLAYKTIQDIYNQNRNLPKDEIIEKIRKRFENVRFFDDLSGYFFMYKMNGQCLMLPIKRSFEGKNLLHFKDAKGVEIVNKAIKTLQEQDEAFGVWYWYKPGSKNMKKKIGYYRGFKPLDIFIGSAFYVDDVNKKVKQIALKIIQSYKYGKKGYIFAYDLSGKTINHVKRSLIGKNRLDLVINHRHIVEEMITGAKINRGGFFISYIASYDPITKKRARKVSFVKMVPGLNWVIGTGFYIDDIRNIINAKYKFLKKELDRTIGNIVILSVFMILFLSGIMIFISDRIKKIIIDYENNLLNQYKETVEQKRIFKLLFEKSKDGIFIARNGKFVACNEMAVEMFGAKSKEELLSYNTLSLSPVYQIDGKRSKARMGELLYEVGKRGVYRCEWLAKKIDGELFWIEVVVTSIKIKDETLFHTACRDITARKKIEKELRHKEVELSYRARHDALTNLPNRYMFNEIIANEILRSKRENKIFAIVFIDLDGFKNINDYYGHNAGDELLIQSSKRFKDEVRETDYLFRFGGDEFVMVLTNCHGEDDVAKVVEKLKKAFSHPFVIQKHFLNVGISMGIALYSADGESSEELLRNADIAMYRAKEEGKNRYVFYQQKMYNRIKKRHALEENLKKAIKDDEFVLFYQPQINVKENKIVGFEALIRWKRGDEILSPARFISMAEQLNLINEIGEIVMDKAMKFAVKLQKRGFDIGRISINLSDKQLKNARLLDTIKRMLSVNNCDSNLIELEVTEGFIMRNIESSIDLLKSFRDIGIIVSMDDFGTGYSSLSYLKKLPLDVIKIDQSFIRDIPGLEVDEAIVNTIIELGKGLNLKVIAEGVEKIEQTKFLLERKCYIIQGYLYSKPIPEKDVIGFIKNFHKVHPNSVDI